MWPYRLPKGFIICDVTRINITKEILLFTPNLAYRDYVVYFMPFYQCHFLCLKIYF